MTIFHRYVVREHVTPFVYAFCVIMFVLILKLMLELIDMLISKGVGVVVMGELLVYNLAWMIALVVPMSVLVATVMAFGRMGASGEIVAMKAAGISMYRIVSPVFFLAVLLTIVMIWFNNTILPEANHRAGSLRKAVVLKKPMLSLKNREGQFISEIPGITIHFKEVNSETEEIMGITLFINEDRGVQTVIIAEKGRFIPSTDYLVLDLTNGEIHQEDPSPEVDRYIRTRFDRTTYIVKNINFSLDTSSESPRNDRSMTSMMMRERIKEHTKMIGEWEQRSKDISTNDPSRDAKIKNIDYQLKNLKHQISAYLVEIHKKNSIPFAAVIFVLIGSSLGILARTSGASIGIGMSIGFFTLYYLFLIGGESAGDRMLIAPWLAMWAPNFILGAVGIGLFVYATRR